MSLTENDIHLIKNYRGYQIYAIATYNGRWIIEVRRGSELVYSDSYTYHNMDIGAIGAQQRIDRIIKEVPAALSIEYIFNLSTKLY